MVEKKIDLNLWNKPSSDKQKICSLKIISNSNMKKILTIFILLLTLNLFSQNIEVSKINCQRLMNRTIGYHLVLKNTSTKTIDAVEWTATFVDKFGDVKEVKKSELWSSGNTVTIDTSKPIEPGKELQVTMTCLVKGATDVKIKITRIHYLD